MYQVSDEKSLFLIKNVANKVIFMDKGYIVESGDPKEILVNPKTPRLQEFLKTNSK